MSARNGKSALKKKAKAPKHRRSGYGLAANGHAGERNGKAFHLKEEPLQYHIDGPTPHNQRFTTIDLFCGAGGITEGFRRAGFECLYANDINPWAIETFRANHPGTRAENRPIEKVDATALRQELKLRPGELDVIVGGPPCQGFSINAPERFLEDPRNSLFKHYIRFLDEFKPKTLLIENVPGMLSLGGGVIFEQILKELRGHGYGVQARILFAAHYGVPQERWRTIILGSRFSPPPVHPNPTHYAVARANFKGGRTMTFRLMPLFQAALLPAVTLKAAIADLPRLEMGEGGEIVTYDRPATSDYARDMRGDGAATFNHFASVLAPQNVERMKYIKPGGSWRDIPHGLLPKGMQKARKSDHTKRYGRLRHDGLSGTILTKCDPHWGAVFLPDQDRALTVREAARIQSFPDSYKFLGPRVAQYEQVGNAVPVLMAEAIARELSGSLERNALAGNKQYAA
ncbi:MAG TPA: DNA cytosine methyltransferase [Verrucomicrobiae bacterium]|jgi:DNA (cytosine-5)-methyltransferase 1|nr:DNA cytosine methyltransferase [Verrucomicrobiae bacterium]